VEVRVAIATGIFPPDIGGPATYVPTIASALVARGDEVRVVTTSERRDLGWRDPVGFPVVRIDRRQPLVRRTLAVTAVVARAAKWADVVLAAGSYLEAVMATRIVRRPLVLKIVADQAWERAANRGWTADDVATFQPRRQRLSAEALRAVRAWYSRQADHVIVPSAYLRGIVTGWGVPDGCISVVYNAVDVPSAAPPTQPRPDRPVRVLTVGRLVRLKGIDLLLRMLVLAPSVRLEVVGTGPAGDELVALAGELGVTDRVTFHGALPPPSVRALMGGCDALALVSEHEGLPHVVLEAMAVGLPVVASAVGGIPEIVQDGETGLLMARTPDAIAAGIGRLGYDETLRQRLIDNAYRLLQRRFDLRIMIDRTRALLCSAAGIPVETPSRSLPDPVAVP
jgi:glycosyltransferase involved in cell wall biosynthesis